MLVDNGDGTFSIKSGFMFNAGDREIKWSSMPIGKDDPWNDYRMPVHYWEIEVNFNE